MTYIKTILFSIIFIIGTYMLLEVMETRQAVISANNPYTQEEIDFTAYGPEGKENALAYQKRQVKYNEQMEKSRAKANQERAIVRAVEESEAKLKNKLVIKGKISKDSDYILYVNYVAKSSMFFCTSFNLFHGTYHKSKRFSYSPSIENNIHKIIFPTDEVYWFNFCDYQLSSIYMDEELLFEKKDNKLKFMGNVYPQRQYPKFTKLRKIWKNQYTIDIYENSHLKIQEEQSSRDKEVIRDTRDIDHLTARQLRKELNLLAEAFNTYNRFHRKKLTAKEGKELLRNEKDLSNYMTKEKLTKYLEELKETIGYKDGNPIDPWGNDYIYRADYGIIYSNGAETFKYKSSLSHKVKPFKTRKREAIKNMAIFAQLFLKYSSKMGYAPNQNEAQKLLRHENDLSIVDFYGKHSLDRYNKIPKKDGMPIDPWGKPYQYREENVEKVINAAIYSLGEDGIRSNDDVFFNDIYGDTRAPSQMKNGYPKGNSQR